MSKKFSQIGPVILAVVVFLVLSLLYFGHINLLNLFPGEKIKLEINWSDVLVGLTIYLKTSVDFALLIGILMKNYPGVKNRIAIETGTALGNTLGTIVILSVWYFFKEIVWLLALMIVIASLVLFKLAKTSLEHIEDTEGEKKSEIPKYMDVFRDVLSAFLIPVNKVIAPLLDRIMPELSFNATKKLSFIGLVAASFSIPFILGLDDFAGYVPLFNVVNVFGFGLGVFLGHMILNVLLFINPKKTIEIVKNPVISLIGSAVFVGLAFWGLYEVYHILAETYFH